MSLNCEYTDIIIRVARYFLLSSVRQLYCILRYQTPEIPNYSNVLEFLWHTWCRILSKINILINRRRADRDHRIRTCTGWLPCVASNVKKNNFSPSIILFDFYEVRNWSGLEIQRICTHYLFLNWFKPITITFT